MRILAIETSCDETAIALLEANTRGYRVLANLVSSQIEIHKKYGGIVPEVAARKHVETMPILLKDALTGQKKPDVIAVTAGPGLVTSLIVGVETAKTLAVVWNKPLVAVNHIEGHILAAKCQIPNSKCQMSEKWQAVKFPAVSLVVSGGHTQLILVKDVGKYEIIGETLDDAAGEAFDKVAKILGLGYPGGPVISRWAQQGKGSTVEFARPMIARQDFNFSFSGIKTSVLYFVQKQKRLTKQLKADICLEFEKAVVEVLVSKTVRAAKKYGAKTVMIGGGVAANQRLRAEMQNMINKKIPEVEYLSPNIRLATDNALMIAVAGYYQACKKQFVDYSKIKVDPNWRVDTV